MSPTIKEAIAEFGQEFLKGGNECLVVATTQLTINRLAQAAI